MKGTNIGDISYTFRLLLIGALALLVSLTFTFSSIAEGAESDENRVENALEDTLTYENDTYTFDREQAIENGLTEEEANVLEENTVENTDQVSTMALPVLAVPAAVKATAKAAAAGGAAVVAGAFMLDVYNTSTASACRSFYGENNIIDNFCVDNDHIDP